VGSENIWPIKIPRKITAIKKFSRHFLILYLKCERGFCRWTSQ
jgi:hypothetical protein